MIYLFPFLLMLVGVIFWVIQARCRRGEPAYLDLGWVFLMVVLVYGIVPGLGLLLAYLGIGEIRDARLAGGIDAALVEEVQLAFLSFAAGFALSYMAFRRYRRVIHDHRLDAGRHVGWLIGLALGLMVALYLAKAMLGVESADDYIGSYTELRSFPLIVQQLFGLGSQLVFSTLVAVIVFTIARWPGAHVRVAILIGFYLVYATVSGGSRSAAFLCFFAYLVSASVYVRGFSMRKILPIGVLALGLFMLAGFLREQSSDGDYLALLQNGEFVSVFVNAIDLKERLESGLATDFGLSFYMVDVMRILPAQLLGGMKFDPATWYVESFYPEFYDAGGGLAFGVIAESVLGLGAPEAFMRGAVLGLLFAWAANRLLARNTSVAPIFVYVWLVVMSYLSFRDTTLSIVSRAIYQLVPILVLIYVAENMRLTLRPRVGMRKGNSRS